MGTSKIMLGGNPATDWHPIQGGVEIRTARDLMLLKPGQAPALWATWLDADVTLYMVCTESNYLC